MELEKNWWTDVEDVVRGSMSPSDAFFFSLLQHETSLQNFELLCCLKDVDISLGDIFTSTKQLQSVPCAQIFPRVCVCVWSGGGELKFLHIHVHVCVYFLSPSLSHHFSQGIHGIGRGEEKKCITK